VILERPAEQRHAVRQQGRRERIARKTLVGLTVETEQLRLVAIDQTATSQSVALPAHAAPRRLDGRAASTLLISCVRRCRVTFSHWRHPDA
jgi:hypothetical protein